VLPRLVTLGIEFWTRTAMRGIVGRSVTVAGVWGDGIRTVEDVDSIVVTPRRPNDELARRRPAICGPVTQIAVIGDPKAPRTVREAVFEGEQLGRAL